MSAQLPVIGVLALAAGLALWRLARAPVGAGRKAVLLALQPLCALLLYCALMPPARPGAGGTLLVASAGSDASALASAAGTRVVALPEATGLPGIARAPDLASALRAHPGTTGLRVVGTGLPARDREAAAGWPLAYAAPPERSGLAELSTPPLLAPGAGFRVGGRVAGLADARVDLLDPAGQRVDRQRIGADGRFMLDGAARGVGMATFAVRVLDAAGRERDRADVPVVVADVPRLRVLLLGGAPQPEWKYLRRWADDAGLDARTRLAAGGGVQLGDAGAQLDAATLDQLDLLIVDERALSALPRVQREGLATAIAGGLGVLVRIGGPLDGAQRGALADLGLALRSGAGDAGDGVPLPLTTPAGDGAATPAGSAAIAAMPALQRRTLLPVDAALPVLARDRAGHAYGWWRTQGRGRVGVATVIDSYRLVLEGHAGEHAALWSALASTLARARPRTQRVAEPGWVGERSTLCAATGALRLQAPDGATVPLPRDAAGCAALWPRQSGWYRWRAGTDEHGVLFVRAPADAAALHANADRAATLALVAVGTARADAPAPARQPGPRWPWWLAFVAAASLGWWLERRPHRAAGAR